MLICFKGVSWLAEGNPNGLTMVLGAERVAQLPPCMLREHPSYLLLLWSHCLLPVIQHVAPSLCSEVTTAKYEDIQTRLAIGVLIDAVVVRLRPWTWAHERCTACQSSRQEHHVCCVMH